MEEVKENVAEKPKMISAEEADNRVQSIIKQAAAQINQLRDQAQQLESILRDKTTDHLFQVLQYSNHFDAVFVEKCAKALEMYLTSIALSTSEEKKEKPQE